MVGRLQPRALLVEEAGMGAEYPFSGEKLSPVLTVYRARDRRCDADRQTYLRIYRCWHSVGLHTARNERALVLGQQLPVSRVIVNQVHCVATGGSFDNGLPFSLSMGCGTWGRNNFSDNMNYPALSEHHAGVDHDPGGRAGGRASWRLPRVTAAPELAPNAHDSPVGR